MEELQQIQREEERNGLDDTIIHDDNIGSRHVHANQVDSNNTILQANFSICSIVSIRNKRKKGLHFCESAWLLSKHGAG